MPLEFRLSNHRSFGENFHPLSFPYIWLRTAEMRQSGFVVPCGWWHRRRNISQSFDSKPTTFGRLVTNLKLLMQTQDKGPNFLKVYQLLSQVYPIPCVTERASTVLDTLIAVLLSQNTTDRNSTKAFEQLKVPNSGKDCIVLNKYFED